MKQGYFYIGNKIHGENRIGLIFVLKITNRSLLKLSQLIYIAKKRVLVIFTSLSRSEKVVFKKYLKANETVRKYFDAEICRLLENIISGLLRPEIRVNLIIRQLTKYQKEDYKNFEYKCKRLKIEIKEDGV